MILYAPANRKISATALVIQPTSSHYCNIHSTPTLVINKNTVKPVLNGTWIEQNPVVTGKFHHPKILNLTPNTCIKWNLPETEKNILSLVVVLQAGLTAFTQTVPCDVVTGRSNNFYANCWPCGLIHHLNKINEQSTSNSRIKQPCLLAASQIQNFTSLSTFRQCSEYLFREQFLDYDFVKDYKMNILHEGLTDRIHWRTDGG